MLAGLLGVVALELAVAGHPAAQIALKATDDVQVAAAVRAVGLDDLAGVVDDQVKVAMGVQGSSWASSSTAVCTVGETMDGQLEPIDEAAALERVGNDDDPYAPRKGRPLTFPREVIERCLYETAVHAGNARKARQALIDWEPDLAWPSAETIYGWVKGRFRNRYAQIATQEAGQLRENIARDMTDLARRLGEAEAEALRKVLAGLADANAVEASLILRNLSSSKQIQLDQEGRLRGRANVIVDHRGLEDITQALVNLGVAEAVDAEAQELPEVELLP
jgi:hypothetical protein